MPVTFAATGFSNQITSENEIHKYAGGLHFLDAKELENILGYITADEMILLTEAIKRISKIDREYKNKYWKNEKANVSSIVCIPASG